MARTLWPIFLTSSKFLIIVVEAALFIFQTFRSHSLKRKVFLRISAPIKGHFAKEHNLDFAKMMDASAYKETYRKAMLKWSEDVRESDPDIFLRLAIEQAKADLEPIWVLVDARRPTDLRFFESERFSNTKVIRIRIQATIETRTSRGWIFTSGIDDKTTECGLDDQANWDLVIENNDLTTDQLLDVLKDVTDISKSFE